MTDLEQAIVFIKNNGGSLVAEMPDAAAFRFAALMHGQSIQVGDKGLEFTLSFGLVQVRVVHMPSDDERRAAAKGA